MEDVFVYPAPLPYNIHECVAPCLDGYTIYINDQLSGDEQKEAYSHALAHIENLDFEKDDVQEIESVAHNHKD